ncbi:bifunctional UDP-sugar hydrolase/5'-nucleotidase [Blastococcus sp. LR1]|uniref:bifunctional metallophosphatase/5'-nucleotidase n=1 Tax=Blastococcus sp. LR1 TaxID=2877000 RepID=UPI001CCC277D|nr:bifunctional metallophosphatase/5'-nucleotidase [Blastococcus sp. LR1]MCA0143406.1 bifunctional metallophosphatase/5'-nucleotidase [Blastococcus sp. LR1]
MTLPSARKALAAGLGFTTLTAVLVAGAPSAGAAPERKPAGPPPVELQLLALNDFHGQLEPPASTSSSSRLPGETGAFGGVEYLATQVRALEAESKKQNTLTVAAGDLIGATPLLSAAFHDEPAIEALNRIGLDYASVGNHEFDEGSHELLRIQHGGCHEDGCADPDRPFEGADFQYLSANAFSEEGGVDDTLLPPYAIHKVQGIDVGFIGMTLEGTPGIVTPSGVAGLDFADEADTANRYAAELKAQGVEAIVVLMHEGGTQTGAGIGVDTCVGMGGPVTEIVPRMSDAIDVVVTGHTHQAYNCTIDGRLVTSASSAGRLVTDIDLTLDRRTGDVLTAKADNVPVSQGLPKDPVQTGLIAYYRELLGPIASQIVGQATATLSTARETLYTYPGPPAADGKPTTVTVLGESPLGNLIADAQLAATDDDADLAFMNPGGVRADIPAGEITYEEAFTTQPFGNYLTTVSLTGAQIQCVLEQQFVNGTVLQPAGITYAVDPKGTTGTAKDPCQGTRVPDDSVRIGDAPVDPAASYRVTVNNFLADGGDRFSLFATGTNRTDVVSPEDDLAALIEYLDPEVPTSPPATDRISVRQ